MKRQIRSSVFETNSSSTHSIAISKAPPVIGKYIHFAKEDCREATDEEVNEWIKNPEMIKF